MDEHDALDREITKAVVALRDLDARVCALAQAMFPVGAYVEWDHGDHVRGGKVVSNGHEYGWHHHALIVESNISGRRIRVSTYRVLWRLNGGPI